MRYKICILLDELRCIKAIGSAGDDTTATVMYRGADSLLIKYQSCHFMYSFWALVRRSSRQYFKVIALVSSFDQDYTVTKSFRNYWLTADFIKQLIRR